MGEDWLIFCEESGDKGIPWKEGSSHYYIITAILVKEKFEDDLIKVLLKHKWRELRLSVPLEWKKLDSRMKRNDKRISRFLRKIEQEGPKFLVTNVICNKHETIGPGLFDTNNFMNYLYGLMFKRIAFFLKSTNSRGKLIIDRNTDRTAQESLRNYISDVTRYYTGSHPRHTKPKWINPEDHSILGFSDFISGLTLRSLHDYYVNVNGECKRCVKLDCIYDCHTSDFTYKRSYRYIRKWNYCDLGKWDWKGLLYHQYEYKDNYKHIFTPK